MAGFGPESKTSAPRGGYRGAECPISATVVKFSIVLPAIGPSKAPQLRSGRAKVTSAARSRFWIPPSEPLTHNGLGRATGGASKGFNRVLIGFLISFK